MAEANRDEALKCFELSKRFHAQNEYELAHKYAEKSVRLYTTDLAESWLEITKRSVEETIRNDSSSTPTESAADVTDPLLKKNKSTFRDSAREKDGPPKSLFTREQVEEVKRLLSIDKNDFYAVLGLKKETDDGEIKKAYRRLALQFHPDKNHAPGADEAFKVVSRAFSCLSDPEKKAHYDRFGAADGISSMGSTGASGGVRFQGPGMFEAEISPEELFNLFFGGGMPMGNGGGFSFASGNAFGPMFVHSFNGGMPSPYSFQYHHQQRRRRGNNPFTAAGVQTPQPTGLMAWAMQLLPMIIMALIVLFSNWTSSTSGEWSSISRHVSLELSSSYPHAFTTSNMRIPYYGTNTYRSYFASNATSGTLANELGNFEKIIERYYVSQLQQKCHEQEQDLQHRRARAAASNTVDPVILESLRSERCPACEQLHALGIRK